MVLTLAAFLAALALPAQGAPDEPLRAKCDEAAGLLTAGKNKEALDLLEPLLKDSALPRSSQRDRANYYAGCAAAALGNDLQAGRHLSRLAPFEQPQLAAHARFLLGRVHHRAGEYTEAAQHYEAVPPSFEKQIAASKQALANPQALPAAEKARLEALVKGPPPDFVWESVFFLGVLHYELKSFPEALARFVLFIQKDRRPAWVEEARLRAGLCHARLGQIAEALKMLQPLQDHPALGRQARWWMARTILGTPGGKPAEAAEHLKKAAAAPEGEAGPTQPEVLLALGHALERAGRPADAAEIYKTLPTEEAHARLAVALAAAKQYAAADEAAVRFEKQHPSSPLLGDVLLGCADAAFAEAQASGQEKHFAEALKRYDRVLAVGTQLNAARYRMAVAQYRVGKVAEALANLRAIPDADRMGELAAVSYLLAECILRTSPPAEDASDALSAAGLLKDLQEAAGQLQKFIPSAGDKAPEATLKLGQALRQIAALLAEPQERVQAANSARELYEAFRAQHPAHPLRPVAEYERANCYVLAGDIPSAIQKLERFRAEPFVNTPVAPLANLRHAQLYRQMRQPAQAVAILAECRTRHEAALLKDPARASWAPLLRYHHAAAIKEMKQPAEAAALLESLLKDFGGSEWAEPSRRLLKEIKP